MKKTPALRQLKASFELFHENLTDALAFKLDLPKSIIYLEMENDSARINLLAGGFDKEVTEQEYKKKKITTKKYPTIIYTMSVIYMLAIFEALLMDCYGLLSRFYIKNLISSKKQLTYEEVISRSDLEDLHDFIIEKELMAFSFKNIADQLESIQLTFKLNFSYKRKSGVRNNWNLNKISDLSEMFSTRNIVLHNNGLVNAKYLIDNPQSKLKIGDRRKIDRSYALDVFGAVLRTGDSLYAIIKKKIGK